MHQDDTLPCFQSHMGIWAIEPQWMRHAVDLVARGLWPTRTRAEMQAAMGREERLFTASYGTAIIRIVGSITKYPSKFTDTSAVLTRRAIGQAVADESIDSILLAIDSPGGQVDGIYELAQAVAKAKQQKPVAAYIEDLGASAAYWIASQAQRVTSNRPGMTGSIGVFAVLNDLSGVAERSGVRVLVKSTGPYKGLGAPGTPITPEAEDYIQGHVDQIGALFFAAVQQGRRLSDRQLTAVTDGRVWMAPEAQKMGLIDGIETFDEAYDWVQRARRPRRKTAASAWHDAAALRTAFQ